MKFILKFFSIISLLLMISCNESALPFYVSMAKLAYCPAKVIKKLSCSFCDKLVEYSTYSVHSIKDDLGRRFQFNILYNDLRTEIIVSFSGPTSEQGEFFNKLYLQGFIKPAELNGAAVETSYWLIYKEFIRPELINKMNQLKVSNRAHYKYVFVGHSFGGSIAVLSAYDLVDKRIIINPIVYTYGQLRIGDINFVQSVNKTLQIIKVIKHDDFLTRSPNCFFDDNDKEYKCFNQQSMLLNRFPQLESYYNGYYGQVATPNNFSNLFVGHEFGPNPSLKQSVLEDPLLNGGLLPRRVDLGFVRQTETVPRIAASVVQPINALRPSSFIPKQLVRPMQVIEVERKPTISLVKASGIETANDINEIHHRTIVDPNLGNNSNISYKKPEINPNYVNNPPMDRYLKNVSFIEKGNSKNSNLKKNKNKKIVVESSTQVGDHIIKSRSETNPLPVAGPITQINMINPVRNLAYAPGEIPVLKSPLNANIGTFYSQPFGIELMHNKNSLLSPCNYLGGIPSCEQESILPNSFSPSTHKYYFKTNVEFCK